MEKRNYPTARRAAPEWQCPICQKTMSARGKAGHLEKIHGRGKPLEEHNPFPFFRRLSKKKRRPLSRGDVRSLMENIFHILIEHTREPNALKIRTALFQCQYLIRELEISSDCTLEEAWERFPISRDELEFYSNKKK